MKVCTFIERGEPHAKPRLGLVEGETVVGLGEGSSLTSVLSGAQGPIEVLKRGREVPIADALLFAPLKPGKIVATIVNTRAMLGGDDVVLTRPRLDMKAPSTVIGPGQLILAPESGIRPEVELAAVVGSTIRKATPSEAKRSIFGFTILNDVTTPSDSKEDAYDAYRRSPETGAIAKMRMRGPLFRSKNHDTFCPMGPWVVTPDELGDLSSRRMTTRFEGSLVQDGSTSEYIFSPHEIAAFVSGFLTLEPGDVVSCGSVGWSREAVGDLDPTEFILEGRRGDLDLEIEGIGKLTNPVAPA